jgi:hypothetical protein
LAGLREGPFEGIAVDDSYLRSRNSQCNDEIPLFANVSSSLEMSLALLGD